jgi:folate-binding protein YgfZ
MMTTARGRWLLQCSFAEMVPSDEKPSADHPYLAERAMNDEHTQALRTVLLPGFGVLRIAGVDAVKFLQGQFTTDLSLLADGRTQLSACCTNQGRVIAIVRFRQLDAAIYALAPADLLARLATQMRKFILRAKVEVLQALDLHVGAMITGGTGAGVTRHAFDAAAMTQSPVPLAGSAEVVTFQYAPGREVVAAPPAAWRAITGLSLSSPDPRAQTHWLAADIEAGLPLVTASTTEQFIPQMLNLDLLDAVSFTKGCYTGQEIVARTHHLGRVKRRAMRFVLPPGAAPAPMSNLLLEGAKAADVLSTAELPDRIEVLAVTNLDAQGRVLLTEDGRAAEPRPIPYGLVTGS